MEDAETLINDETLGWCFKCNNTRGLHVYWNRETGDSMQFYDYETTAIIHHLKPNIDK